MLTVETTNVLSFLLFVMFDIFVNKNFGIETEITTIK